MIVANQPFGFVALLGLIALAGMIMRNTVILVDQIDRDIGAGLTRMGHHRRHRPPRPAGGADRTGGHPGMIPLSARAFWGPMAITIMGGLMVATVLTLVVVPALYAMWFRVRADEHAEKSSILRADEPTWEVIPVRIAAE